MAELVHQTWTRITGRPWSDAAKGGFTTGSFADNIALQKRLLGGWNPYAAAPKAAAGAPAATAAAPRPGTVFRARGDTKVYLMGNDGLAHWIKGGPILRAMGFDESSIASIPSMAGIGIGPAITTPPPSTAVPVDPGLAAQQWEAALALQKQLTEEQSQLQRESQADVRRLQEAQLGANPADFVAYELYKRSLQEQGYTPQGAVRTDPEIQDLFNLALGLDAGDSVGTGRFGVDIPTTGSISRSELQAFNPTDVGILSSFLRGGVETGGGFQGINPEDFFTELEEGLIPTLTPQRTQYRL